MWLILFFLWTCHFRKYYAHVKYVGHIAGQLCIIGISVIVELQTILH